MESQKNLNTDWIQTKFLYREKISMEQFLLLLDNIKNVLQEIDLDTLIDKTIFILTILLNELEWEYLQTQYLKMI
jgi:hypothetical protein